MILSACQGLPTSLHLPDNAAGQAAGVREKQREGRAAFLASSGPRRQVAGGRAGPLAARPQVGAGQAMAALLAPRLRGQDGEPPETAGLKDVLKAPGSAGAAAHVPLAPSRGGGGGGWVMKDRRKPQAPARPRRCWPVAPAPRVRSAPGGW